MEVASDQSSPEKTEPYIRDYWPRYKRQAILFTLLMQIAITAMIIGTLLFNRIFEPSIALVMFTVAIFSASLLGNILLVTQLLQPLRDLTAAFTHVSGEPNDVRPPNPNAHNYQKTGFSKILQIIYENAVQRDQPTAAPTTAVSDSLVTQALNHSNDSLVVLDEMGEIIYASAHAPVRLNSDGKQELTLMFDDDVTLSLWLQDCRDRLVHASTSWLRVADKLPGDEERHIYDITATYDKDTKAPVVLSLHDRTDHYAPEDEQLDFIAFAAHELRGPITVIRGYSDVLQQELPATQEMGEARIILERLSVAANRLSSYVNNILNAAKFDRRHMRLNLTEQNLATIYQTVADDMETRARTQGRLLSVMIPDTLPTIAADPSSLSEVFANLIDNAIKYSNEGGSVTVTAHTDGEDAVQIDVVDQGIGIPGNVIGNLFQKFYRSQRIR